MGKLFFNIPKVPSMNMKANKKNCASIVLIVLFTISAYTPVFKADFIIFDDQQYVTQNEWVSSGLSWNNVIWAFTHFHSANWHPLTWLSHMLDCEIYGMNATGHHVSSLVLHIINSILVFHLFSLMTGAYWRCLALALLFSLHPLHVESVAWIAERKDMLSTFFGLLCIISYYHYTQTFQKRHYYYCFVWFCFSLMSKPMLVTMPFLLILLDIWPIHRKDIHRFIRDKWIFFPPIFGIALITLLAQFQEGAINSLSSLGLMPRILNAFSAIGIYLIRTLWPSNYSILYPHPGYDMNMGSVIFGVITLSTLLIIGIYTFKKMPFILTGLLWFLIALMPVIGIIQVGSQAMADRYTYIPHIGLFWTMIWFVSYISYSKTRRVIAGAVLLLALILFGSKTFFQAKVWQNEETLYLQAITNTKHNYLIYNNLGVLNYCNHLFERALTYFDKSLAINPDYTECRVNKAECLVQMKRFDEGITAYQAILENDNTNINALLGLAEIYRLQNNLKQALIQCQKALKYANKPEKTYVKIAYLFEQTGQYQSSAYFFKQLLDIQSDAPRYHYEYARMMAKLKHFDEATYHFKQAISLDPLFAKAYNNLGALYARNNQIQKAYENISIAFRLAPEDDQIYENYKRIKEKIHLKE